MPVAQSPPRHRRRVIYSSTAVLAAAVAFAPASPAVRPAAAQDGGIGWSWYREALEQARAEARREAEEQERRRRDELRNVYRPDDGGRRDDRDRRDRRDDGRRDDGWRPDRNDPLYAPGYDPGVYDIRVPGGTESVRVAPGGGTVWPDTETLRLVENLAQPLRDLRYELERSGRPQFAGEVAEISALRDELARSVRQRSREEVARDYEDFDTRWHRLGHRVDQRVREPRIQQYIERVTRADEALHARLTDPAAGGNRPGGGGGIGVGAGGIDRVRLAALTGRLATATDELRRQLQPGSVDSAYERALLADADRTRRAAIELDSAVRSGADSRVVRATHNQFDASWEALSLRVRGTNVSSRRGGEAAEQVAAVDRELHRVLQVDVNGGQDPVAAAARNLARTADEFAYAVSADRSLSNDRDLRYTAERLASTARRVAGDTGQAGRPDDGRSRAELRDYYQTRVAPALNTARTRGGDRVRQLADEVAADWERVRRRL